MKLTSKQSYERIMALINTIPAEGKKRDEDDIGSILKCEVFDIFLYTICKRRNMQWMRAFGEYKKVAFELNCSISHPPLYIMKTCTPGYANTKILFLALSKSIKYIIE